MSCLCLLLAVACQAPTREVGDVQVRSIPRTGMVVDWVGGRPDASTVVVVQPEDVQPRPMRRTSGPSPEGQVVKPVRIEVPPGRSCAYIEGLPHGRYTISVRSNGANSPPATARHEIEPTQPGLEFPRASDFGVAAPLGLSTLLVLQPAAAPSLASSEGGAAALATEVQELARIMTHIFVGPTYVVDAVAPGGSVVSGAEEAAFSGGAGTADASGLSTAAQPARLQERLVQIESERLELRRQTDRALGMPQAAHAALVVTLQEAGGSSYLGLHLYDVTFAYHDDDSSTWRRRPLLFETHQHLQLGSRPRAEALVRALATCLWRMVRSPQVRDYRSWAVANMAGNEKLKASAIGTSSEAQESVQSRLIFTEIEPYPTPEPNQVPAPVEAPPTAVPILEASTLQPAAGEPDSLEAVDATGARPTAEPERQPPAAGVDASTPAAGERPAEPVGEPVRAPGRSGEPGEHTGAEMPSANGKGGSANG